MEYGLIGAHLPHSYSKLIHEMIGDYSYALKELAAEELDAFLKAKDFRGINVTIPYKQDVIPYLDEIDPQAKSIGAVNTIVNRKGRLIGYNTDFIGLRDLILRSDIVVKGKKAIILGTGGTSKTAAAVLADLGAAELVKASRSGASEDADVAVISYEDAYARYADAQIIVNTTPAGMYPNIEGCAIDLTRLPDVEAVVDVVYNPLSTKLVSDARDAGKKATGGLYMLVGQAVAAHDIFLDTKSEAALTERIFKKIENDRRNIVLTGMPGSGKSVVSKRLKEMTGRKVLELDDLIVEKAGMEITEIFAKYGEQYFRDLETEVVRENAKESACIISTGGGCILRDENVRLLKQNGRIFFLDRPVEDLIPTDDRPLASNADAIRKRFEERYERYCSTADVIIDRPQSVKDAAKRVLEEL